MSQIGEEWTALSNFPVVSFDGAVVRISSNEFVVVAGNDSRHYSIIHPLYKYSSHHGQWTVMAQYPPSNHAINEYPHIAADPKRKQLFLTNLEDEGRIYDIKSGSWTEADITSNHTWYGMVCANGTMHTITCGLVSNHCIWNPTTRRFDTLCDFGRVLGRTRPPDEELDGVDELREFAMVFVPSKQTILAIGVQEGADFLIRNLPKSIWKYTVCPKRSNSWEKIPGITLPPDLYCETSHVVLTASEEYIVMCSFMNQDSKFDVIYVLDIRNIDQPIMKVSRIRSPIQFDWGYIITRCGARQCTRNELLFYGWTRSVIRECQSENTLKFPPNVLMRLMIHWYDQEMLHLIVASETREPAIIPSRNHFAISMNEVVSNLLPVQGEIDSESEQTICT